MNDELLINRCLQLAKLSEGLVSPNPMVGAVLVNDNKIISEGYHKAYGLPHAEYNAINNVKDKALLKGSILYVNLEPCCHYGKTPPCTDLILKSGIKKVVICNTDPNPKVAGTGIRILKEAGVDVVVGVLKEKGLELNKRFFTFHNKKRPYIILKWAQTLDGFMDIERRASKVEKYWITNEVLRVWAHKQRAENDCILVGKTTIINDNPQLNVRYFKGNNPIRIAIDKDLTIPKDRFFFDGQQKTIIFNSKYDLIDGNTTFVKLNFETQVLEQIIHYIYSINKNSLIVEGGLYTLESFINSNLWDEANVLVGDKCFKNGLPSPKHLLNDKEVTKTYYDSNWIEQYANSYV